MAKTPEELQRFWSDSDDFHNSFLIPHDDALDHARKNSTKNGLREIAVSTAHGKYIHLLLRSLKAKRVLEVGTLGGYSAIWMARALPDDGHLTTCELVESIAKVAQENIDYAGLTNKVTIKIGAAADTLKALEPEEPFDLIFIDADKINILTYFVEAKRLIKQGGVIIVDNVVREGRVHDLTQTDDHAIGARKLLAYLKDDKEVEATTVQTVGDKGHDGFLYALRL